ncbi:MAG: type 1 periplasmic-binding domain-containing protein [Acidimicrobiales bacterium]
MPFLLVLGLLVGLLAIAPTTRPPVSATVNALSPYGGAGSGSGSTAAASGTGGAATATVQGGAAPAPQAAAANPYTVGGVKCAPGVLQVTWSPYAPPCIAAWHANNGGATAPGVSATTITIAYREEGESSDVNAIRSIMPGVLPTDAQALYDLNVFVQAFNAEYELYGRKVVIKPFMAQGDALEEMVGQDTQGAQEDAATAASLGAFADITPLPTTPYAEALVQNHVISFNNLIESQSFLESSAPYAYTLVPSIDDVGKALTSFGCTLGTSSVTYAKDTSLNGKQRIFGLIVPEDPQFQQFENEEVAGLQRCGVKVPVVVNYAIDLSTIQQQMQNAISQMQAAGVTTVVCGCDPVGTIYATQAADQQNYGPEWSSEWLPFQFERLYSQDQWAHSTEIGLGPALPQQDVEAYKVFKMVDPGANPAEPLYMYLYYELMYLFNGLQAAGPDLTPASLLNGFHHLPPTQLGQVGQWFYGAGSFWPFDEAQVSYWNPNATNAFDGKPGDFSSCFGGQWFSLEAASDYPHTLDCPGLPS